MVYTNMNLNIYHVKWYVITTFLLLFNEINYATTEIITLSIGAAALAGAWLKWDNVIKDNTVCRFMECCNDDHVPYDLEKLKQSLSDKMYGQPLVNELVNILRAHKESVYNKDKANKKALVISLHGWSGVGKNYAATMIAEALYKKGMQSKFVKVFMGKKDFDCTDLEKSKQELITNVNSIVKKCGKSLIIFDEIHDMCPSVLDAIKPMLDHHHAVDGVDYRDTIFIFISNTGGKEIASNLLKLYGEGVKRNEVEFHNFEPVIRRTAYHQGGLEKSATIAHHLIDHYIPFLPLEQNHVELCALAEFRFHGILNPSEEMMAEALTVITYGPSEDQPIFANNGCKRFTRHIPYVIQKFKSKLN
ncbi:torsin-1B isoform X2 [Plodia interpunctella]|uniref:torsin-1B isoform X2 n=1 Tax=Plodia interpunctella TaxID=58824 RepID=UPI0023684608|nr:torsin-1B isoform X2 [Plodia interpunctella]